VRITTRVTYASINDFINNAQPKSWEGFEYSGPVAELKKGRGELQSAASSGQKSTDAALGIAGADNGIQRDYRGQGDILNNQSINTQGGLSPLVAKQLANERGQIGKAYSSAASAADRGLSMRGMGVAPSGLSASIKNTAINNEGQAETGAVGNAFGLQNQLNESARNYDVGQQQQYDPLRALHAANEGVGATTNAAQALNKAGSTLGDIGSGIGTVMGAASTLSGLGGFKGIGSSVMGK
jgi:hypothetical protein